MTTDVTCELDAADELRGKSLTLRRLAVRWSHMFGLVVTAQPYQYVAPSLVSTVLAEPVEPEPAKLHDDMTLADWKRAFANYDRKPWQS
jgi:hypothetical protein